MSAARVNMPPEPPSLAAHHERLLLDRHLRDGRALVAAMALGPGQRVLQLDGGAGLLAEHLADVVGADGEVLALDPLPLRVQIAHQRSRHNLRFQVGDTTRLARFRSASFDAVVANGVLHGWPDVGAALAECLRLLAPGGCLGLATQSAAHPHPAERMRDALLAEPGYADAALPAEAVARPQTLDALDALLRGAGFAGVSLRAEPEQFLYANAQAAIESMQAGAWGEFLAHLPERRRADARAEVARRLEALRGPDGIRHDAMRIVALAWKPRAQSPSAAQAATLPEEKR